MTRLPTIGGLLAFAVAGLFAASSTQAQFTAFEISGGYSHIWPDSDKLPVNHDGAYIDADFAWELSGRLPLYAGVGVSTTGTFASHDVFVPVSANSGFFDTLYSDLGYFSVEGRLALPWTPPEARGLFIMPRIGAGLLVNSYAIDTIRTVGSVSFFDTRYHDGVAFDIRPTIEAGYAWNRGAVGAQISYMAAWGDFGAMGHNTQELRAGVFLRLRF